MKTISINNNTRRWVKMMVALPLMVTAVMVSSCNDDWTDEQYTQYISFRSPLNSDGVTNLYVPYTRRNTDKTPQYGPGMSSYNLPVIVSGSTTNGKDITVHVAHDPDTLATENYAHFQNRKDLWYEDMSSYATYPETTTINAGENIGLLPISFNFDGIDMSKKWVLPITVVDNPDYGYRSHPRKNYNKALLRIFPFNDYSGDYSGTAMRIYSSDDPTLATAKSEIRGYVVNDTTIFFYAGDIDETRMDRANYKVYAHFSGGNQGTVDLYSKNPDMKLKVTNQASYSIQEMADATQPYLVHRYVVIHNIDYTYVDYTSVPGYEISYGVDGTLTLERKINTQIPDEDQAIQWE